MNEKDKKKIQEKWEVALNLPIELSGISNNIQTEFELPIMIGSEPEWHRKKKNRFNKMKKLLGDKFFDIVDREEYESFMNEKFLISNPIANDLVSVQPLSAPSSELIFMDYTYNSINDSRIKKMKQLLKINLFN